MFDLGNQPAGIVLYLPFDTYSSAGASVTITGLAVTDIEIYKNGSVTQRASDNGYALLDTDGIDFDGSTGLHGFSIDLADNSDSGFYAVGSQYWVHINAITCDSQTIKLTYRFRIVAAESSAGVPKVDVSHFGGSAGTFASGRPEVNVSHWAGGTNEVANFSTVFDDDFADAYDTAENTWCVQIGSASGVILRDNNAYGEFVSAVADADGSHLLETTIATLASQTSFTLGAGSDRDDGYNDHEIIIRDADDQTRVAVGIISDYTGSTRTVNLVQNPGIFTMAVGDRVQIMANRALKPTLYERRLVVDASGIAQAQLAQNVQHGGGSSSLVMDNVQVTDSLTLAPTTINQLTVTNATTLSGIFTAANGGNNIVGVGAVASVTGNLGGSVQGNVLGNVAGTVGSVNGNVGGNVTGSVGSVAAGGITASSIAADAIGASELAADAIVEIQAGLATAANLALVKAKTDLIPAAPAAVGDVPTANQNADAWLDRADAIETGITPRKALRAQAASAAGNLSGGGTSTETIKGVGVATTRLSAAVDEDGNRTVTLTLD